MRAKSGHRVLIVGCGELGSRHLQAVASLPMVKEIEVVDPRPEAHQLGRERLAELPGPFPPVDIRWHSSLEDASDNGGLCIIATQAHGRGEILRSVADSLGYSSILLEKLAFQSVAEMEDSVEFAQSRQLSVWVNCQTRAVPFYLRVKEQLDLGEPLVFSSLGGMQYLATNGIHAVDLFAFYDGCSWIKSVGPVVDPVLHASKRGEGLYDLSGTLHGYTEKGSSISVSYVDAASPWGHISVATSQYRCVVDQTQRWAVEADARSDWAWRQVPFEGSLLVSQTTKEFAANILTSGECALPTLEQSLVSHRFILGELQPHFGRLLGKPLDFCPVT